MRDILWLWILLSSARLKGASSATESSLMIVGQNILQCIWQWFVIGTLQFDLILSADTQTSLNSHDPSHMYMKDLKFERACALLDLGGELVPVLY